MPEEREPICQAGSPNKAGDGHIVNQFRERHALSRYIERKQ